MPRRLALLLLLTLPFSLSAEPRKHRFDKKFWVLTAVTVGSAFAAIHTTHDCVHRLGHDAGCFGGSYSSNTLKDGFRIGFTTGFVALSYAAKKDDSGWLWSGLQAVPLTWNTVTITQNLHKRCCKID